jgi:hypothetical protein
MNRNFFALLFASATLTLGLSTLAEASDYGVAVGIRSDSATSNTSSTNISGNTDYQGGVVANIDLVSSLQIRTGILYTTRQYGYSPAIGATGQAVFTYADVPLGLLWALSDYGGPFVGANFGFNVSSSCPGGNCTGVASSIAGYQFGVHFKFAPQFGAELYYESMAAVMPGIDNPKAVAGNIFVTF